MLVRVVSMTRSACSAMGLRAAERVAPSGFAVALEQRIGFRLNEDRFHLHALVPESGETIREGGPFRCMRPGIDADRHALGGKPAVAREFLDQ